MLTALHIILALSAIALSIQSNFRPAPGKLKTSYMLAGGTLASGILLIIANGASILRTCLTGIVFFGVVSILNETARRKLAYAADRS